MIDNDSKPTEWTIKPKLRSRARSLRRDLTDAEHVIWKAVRAHRLNGMSFRRQTPVGPYIVDFVCHDAMLILEVDGGQHFEAKQEAYDQRRDEYLRRKGFHVLRFTNHDVMTNRAGLLETILSFVSSPLPNPPPQAGEGAEAPIELQSVNSNPREHDDLSLPRLRGRDGEGEEIKR